MLSLYSDTLMEGWTGEEFIADMCIDVEADVLRLLEHNELQAAIGMLDAESRHLIRALYFTGRKKTVRQLSQECNVPVMTLQNRKLRILRNH